MHILILHSPRGLIVEMFPTVHSVFSCSIDNMCHILNTLEMSIMCQNLHIKFYFFCG